MLKLKFRFQVTDTEFTILSQMADASQTLEARALAEASLMESIRFLVEADTDTNGAPDDNSKKKPITEAVGEKVHFVFIYGEKLHMW